MKPNRNFRVPMATSLPPLASTQVGELVYLTAGSDANKLHIRTAAGWLKLDTAFA